MIVTHDVTAPVTASPTVDEVRAELASVRGELEGMKQALSTSRTIGAATGILMERHKVTADVAFQMLVKTSQNRNRKLRDIASELVFSGVIEQ